MLGLNLTPIIIVFLIFKETNPLTLVIALKKSNRKLTNKNFKIETFLNNNKNKCSINKLLNKK